MTSSSLEKTHEYDQNHIVNINGTEGHKIPIKRNKTASYLHRGKNKKIVNAKKGILQ